MTRKLSTREKRLAGIVLGIAFLFLNAWLIDSAITSHSRLRGDLARKEKQLRLAQNLTQEPAFWEQRDTWLKSAQPRLTNADSAGVQLLNRVTELAKKHGVLPENPALRPVSSQPAYQSVAVELETKSAWKPLIAFVRDLQGPEEFVVLEMANLKIDTADPTQMRGRFKIARWFSPP